jgi:hypothetical protein
MLLFRDEEHVRATHAEPGAVFPVEQLWELAQAWYGDRLDPAWVPRTREQSQAILSRVGLVGPFWRL